MDISLDIAQSLFLHKLSEEQINLLASHVPQKHLAVFPLLLLPPFILCKWKVHNQMTHSNIDCNSDAQTQIRDPELRGSNVACCANRGNNYSLMELQCFKPAAENTQCIIINFQI